LVIIINYYICGYRWLFNYWLLVIIPL
jgi:hypothetical protein